MALDSLTIQPAVKDTLLNEATPDQNYGNNTIISVYDGLLVHRSILEFALSTLAGKTPITATLSLYYYNWNTTDPDGLTVWAYKLTRTDWIELQATWNIYKTGSNWKAAGGDYVTSSPSGASETVPSGYEWMTWNILALLNDALGNSDDLELLMKFATEDVVPNAHWLQWYSAEYAVDTAKRPKLVVEYIEPPTNVVASDGTCADKVVITWTKANGVAEYQVYRDDFGLGWLGDVDTYDDTGADAPVITAGATSASKGKKFKSVVLNNSGESIADGTVHTYKVRSRYSGIESGDSNTNTGYRGASPITYQWQRSAADSDAAYSDLNGATTKKHYDYTAPAYSAGRYYRCSIAAFGSTTVYSTVARGYRRNPALPLVPVQAEVVIKNPAGGTLAYCKNAHGISTDYRINELAIMEFTIPAESDAGEYLVYPNEAWLYIEGVLKDIFKIIDIEGRR